MGYLISWITKIRSKKILTGKNNEFKTNTTNVSEINQRLVIFLKVQVYRDRWERLRY